MGYKELKFNKETKFLVTGGRVFGSIFARLY